MRLHFLSLLCLMVITLNNLEKVMELLEFIISIHGETDQYLQVSGSV